MKGLLLIGGQAARLRPMSKNLAKSLLPICDKPILTYQIRQLREAGVYDIILATGEFAEQYYMARDLYRELDVHIDISIEHQALGTAGAIANARAKYIGGDQVLVLNADILSDIDLRSVQRAHANSGKVATLVGYPVADPSRYGLLQTRVDPSSGLDEVVGFMEKPGPDAAPPQAAGGLSALINAGIYILEPQAVRAIPEGRQVSIERETFPALIEKFGGLNLHRLDGLWVDIGTFAGYYAANMAVVRQYLRDADEPTRNLFWRIRDEHLSSAERSYEVFDNAVYAEKSVLQGPNARTERNVVLMAGAEVGAGSRLENCILLPGSAVGRRCDIRNAILGTGVRIPDQTLLHDQLVFEDAEPMPFAPGE